MFANAPERRMRSVRLVLLVLWLVLIASLFHDPLTPALTRAENSASPFRIDPDQRVEVQGQPLPSETYPMGARIFWTMLVPIVPMFLMLFGHEAWRRICPLSMATQLPQLVGLQAKARVFNRKTGLAERRSRLVGPGSFLARHFWELQFGLLWFGITSRLLFINSDRLFLAFFLLSILAAAVVVGLLFGGKTWCQYLCPISPVQKIYTGPGGLLESKAYRAKGLSQSTCRTPTPAGDQSTCVGCAASCPDKDLERAYWDSLTAPGKRFAYYGYFGLVLAFYSYYYFYAGNWEYYFSGAWTHEPTQLGTLLSPGFFVAGRAIPVPKLLAAPLTTGLFVVLAYASGVMLESAYGALRKLVAPLSAEAQRHHALTVSAFLTFNVFYLFGGRPNLLLLPTPLLRTVDMAIVLASALWLAWSLPCRSATHRRESLARNTLTQLGKLKLDFSEILEGRSLQELNADEIHTLSRTLAGLPLETRRSLYRGVLREALHGGEVSEETSLGAMREIRQQMGLSEEEHHQALAQLMRREPGIGSGEADDATRVRLSNYKLALEGVVRRCLRAGASLQSELASAPTRREIEDLWRIFDVTEAEHREVLAAVLRERDVVLREAREFVAEISELTRRVRALSSSGGPARRGRFQLLVHHFMAQRRELGARFLKVLSGIENEAQALELAREFVVASAGDAADLARAAPGAEQERGVGTLSRPVRQVLVDDRADAEPPVAVPARPPVRECLEPLARGPEPVPAAIALSALADLDLELAREVAARLATVEDRHWLIDEVLAGLPGTVARDERHSPAAARIADDYSAEPSTTIERMEQLFQSPLFRHLDLTALAAISRSAEVRSYRGGALVCRQGDRSDCIFVVCDGTADIHVEREGRSTWINAVGEGDSIGELGVFTKRPRSATVIASGDATRLISIGEDIVMSVLNRNAKAAMSFVGLLSSREQGMIARI